MPQAGESPSFDGAPAVSISASRQFASWLAGRRLSPAFTTCQNGKLFLIGLHPDGRLSVFERTRPGYARGLALHGDFAIVGRSKSRENRTFTELMLQGALAQRGTEALCGLAVVALRGGGVAPWLWIDALNAELYGEVTLPNVRRPMALGLKTDEIRRTIYHT